MSNLPTAEEFFEQGGTYPELAIKFAQLHVQAALQAASENAKCYVDHNGEWVSSNVSSKIKKESILNAYPLENIK